MAQTVQNENILLDPPFALNRKQDEKAIQLKTCGISYGKKKTSKGQSKNPRGQSQSVMLRLKDSNGLKSYSHRVD